MNALSRFIVQLRSRGWREKRFLVSVWLKGFDGLLELLGGVTLLTASPTFTA